MFRPYRLAMLGLFAVGCSREAQPPAVRPVAAEIHDATSPVASTPPGVAFGPEVSGLRLGIALEGKTLVVHLVNVGKAPLVVMSHVATHERQNDWLTVTIVDAKGSEREVALDDDRDKSAPVNVTLAAGAELVDRWDLADWSARKRNGSHPLGKGDASILATYRVAYEVWRRHGFGPASRPGTTMLRL